MSQHLKKSLFFFKNIGCIRVIVSSLFSIFRKYSQNFLSFEFFVLLNLGVFHLVGFTSTTNVLVQ